MTAGEQDGKGRGECGAGERGACEGGQGSTCFSVAAYPQVLCLLPTTTEK